VVCLATPAGFYAVGQFFADFSQVTDEEVRDPGSRAGRKGKVTRTTRPDRLRSRSEGE
jgi:predicted phosphoribosyltransferase